MGKDVNLATIVQQVYKLVASLTDQERNRVMRSVRALFDDKEEPTSDSQHDEGQGSNGGDLAKHGNFPAPVALWMKRNGVTQDHLDQVFHTEDGKVSIIADSVPGATKKEQTVNCYVLEGARAFLETGVAKFTDSCADDLCERIGCRDKTNHAGNRASAGNKLTGSRKDGFTVVAPGLLHAAKLIKEIADPEIAVAK